MARRGTLVRAVRVSVAVMGVVLVVAVAAAIGAYVLMTCVYLSSSVADALIDDGVKGLEPRN
jgi:hypothetical protein